MSEADFDLFDDFLQEKTIVNILDCAHNNKTENGYISLCVDCGQEISKNVSKDKEWRYYGQSDSKHSADPNRCQLRRVEEEKNIYKDVEGMGFKDSIIMVANGKYLEVTQDKIHRGNTRKAIIFACIFLALKESGNPQSCEPLITIFNIDRKTGLRGLKIVNLGISKKSTIPNTHITPANLVSAIMNEFSASLEQKQEVIDLYNKIKGKSTKINRSRPQSVAAGLTYFWIRINKKPITLKEFSEKAKLSELTVTKVSKEIANILGIEI